MNTLDATITDLRAMAVGSAGYAPVSADFLARLADDIEQGGPVWTLIGGHPQAMEPLFAIRAAAAVRWLMLSGHAPELGAHLENLTSGIDDRDYAEQTWRLSTRALLDHPELTRAALDLPVQQHEPSRASVLLSALGMLGAPKVRLLEIGACAGLNLLIDQYRWFGPGWEWGDPSSPVRLAAHGRSPGDLTIVERAGCDLAPRDPADPADVLIVHSFLPPEREIQRLELDDAIALAARSDVRVDKADAVGWLAAELARPSDGGEVLTVVWHSLLWGYLTSRQQADIEKVLGEAATRMPLARVGFEPHDWTLAPRLQVTVYS
ncbi:DUF2332 domain-containing protein [Streptomyces sp. AK02-01A]|uniref:DUF2332 domain-containing protein n=1 Tax=Streptomyces sp. AK02-01A TaxID=3028648 RepID=UPI0029B37173|nr:DUF2332 domain-containing protein [Streptomyces sp. AK02-01A]MDX3850977.1 DUF2332 domain-containing protein [Streptomyces sp. AK02-01A]